ncbi:MAG: zinc transporter ZntB [Roseovarius sp.]
MLAVQAMDVDEAGQGHVVEPEGGAPEAAVLRWTRVDLSQADGADWLAQSGLDPLVMAALGAQETRPRCTVHGEGALMNLRGVNLNPGDEVEDMVSVRLWITGREVISAQLRRLMAAGDVWDAALRGQGPVRSGDLVARLALRLADRAEPVIAGLNERIDDIEEKVDQGPWAVSRADLGDVRRMAIKLRRHIAPQRDALSTFEIEDLPWLTHEDRSRLREAVERVTRLSEELDAIRDRAQVVQDQIMEHRSEVMNRQMLILSVVAAIFLPLGLLTGLLGINVGGMPGADDPRAFWFVTVGIVVIGLVLFGIFRMLGWLRR